jgi:agmatinase
VITTTLLKLLFIKFLNSFFYTRDINSQFVERNMELGWQGLPFNFLELDDNFSKPEDSKFVVIPVPFDSTVSSTPGCREAPFSIIKASKDIRYYDIETNTEPYKEGVYTINALDVCRGNAEDTIQRVKDTVSEIVEHDKIPITLGGEHSISIGAADAFEDDVVVVCFDAHADLKWGYEGCQYSHACVVRRIADKKRVIVLGVRSIDLEEKEFLDNEPRVSMTFMHELNDDKINSLIDEIKKKKVYVCIDLDVLDPSIAPGVTTPEPGGMNFEQLLKILRKIANNSYVVGFDITECNPLVENSRTPFLAAKLIYKVMAYIGERP